MSLYPPARARAITPSSGALASGALLIAVGYLALVGRLVATTTFDIWGGALLAPILVLACLPWFQRWQGDLRLPWFATVAALALVMKLLGAVARWYVIFYLYDGEGDAARYHRAGSNLAALIQGGQLPPLLENAGTGFIEAVTGMVYAVTGASLIVGFLAFAWLGFVGQMLAFRAFVEAVPEGQVKRYALLVFFLPSLLFWPSSIGKEAWMLLGIGACMLGTARMLTKPPRGLLPLGLGLAATAMVRPHVTLLVAVAGVMAFAIGRTSGAISRRAKVASLLALGGATFYLIRMAAAYVGVNDLSVEGVSQAWETRSENTATGGSSFSAQPVSGPQDVPMALLTLLLRPFPWEAGGLMPLLASLEGVLVGGLIALAALSAPQALRAIRSNPYVTFCLAYLLLYAVLFSGFANFAILTRQRTLAIPAFLVLLCLPTAQRAVQARRDRWPQAAGPVEVPDRQPLAVDG
jgi:hypothetical protein